MFARRQRGNDEGSMAMALLVTLVAMSLTAGLVPLVLNQITSTRTVDARTVALNAAQAGIDATVGQLRLATTLTTLSGGTTKLVGTIAALPPCDAAITGTVADAAGLAGDVTNLRYSVTIDYYGVPDNSVDDTPAQLSCQDHSIGTVPTTAVLTSTGTSTTAGPITEGAKDTRTLQATYTFKVNNENITGGAVQLASPTTNGGLCMDGGTDASPAAGTPATVQTCKEGGAADQRFAYTTDLNIKLIGSETALAPNGMCLEAPMPHATNGALTFQPCLGRVAKQQWSLNDSSAFQGTSNGSSLDNFCINAATAGSAGALVLGGCSGVSNKNIWRPQAGVGAGMASATTKQLVNYKQFSRCLDVTNFDYVNKNVKYEIVWFCKQSPDGNAPVNQQWTTPLLSTDVKAPIIGELRTPNGYCLRTSDTPGGYPTMKACTAVDYLTDKTIQWKVFGDTSDYTSSYRIVDANGYCLTPTDLTVKPADTHTDGTAKAKIATCTSAELQKWNAPPNFNKPLAVTNLMEK
ncbi:ricin-type beta-trefoil lectin domain protein [Actinoplanes sp. N902-109]|uniref:ricin-type beta-trefoil lectin domain protein n=1 Tax=Actinoplanes sp. (strain N902-109) TaxID=649831 RepID=UPI00032934A0|nr:ricin-type beta-trefoil lectin domain protein [Actinoplanes sp. N902-109]AGL14715.1 hypothetical protein L083_1205 [Actinoplanes sp. N902-109]